jgi:two-component sensor histidine kinase
MAKVSSHTHTQAQLDIYANANNPNSAAYADAIENRTNQLNQFHDAYYKSRGLPPPDYSQLAQELKNS